MAYYPQEKTIYTFPEKLTVLHPHIVCRKCNRPVDRLLALVRVGDGGCIKVQCHGKYAEVPIDTMQGNPIGSQGQAFEKEQGETNSVG